MLSNGLLNLVSQSNAWLSERQAAIARNIANANTPGYRAVDVQPFDEVLATSGSDLSKSHAAHISVGPTSNVLAVSESEDGMSSTYSGNSVSLEKEMLKAGDVSARYALGTSVYKSFHRMIISCAR